MEFFNWTKLFGRNADKRRDANGSDAEMIVHVTSNGRLYVDPEKQLRTKEAQAVINNVESILESLKPSPKPSAAK